MLKRRKDDTFDLNKEFEWFEDIFTKVQLETIYSYKRYIIDFWNRPRETYVPLSKVERFSLYSLIRQEVQCSVDELFYKQNERNLISKRVFNKTIKTLIAEGKVVKEKGEIRLI